MAASAVLRHLPVRVLIALALLAVVGSSVVDKTLSCPVLKEASAISSAVEATVVTPQAGAHITFWPTPKNWWQPAVQPGVDVQTRPPSISWDGRHVCVPAPHVSLALGPHGLPKDATVTTHWLGREYATCKTSGRVLFRARIALARGVPTGAELYVADARGKAPLLYVDWTPRRITTYASPKCEASP